MPGADPLIPADAATSETVSVHTPESRLPSQATTTK
jgi:hypothetical protein